MIEYLVVSGDRDKSIGQAINEAAKDGYRYVDFMFKERWGSDNALVIYVLMSREESK